MIDLRLVISWMIRLHWRVARVWDVYFLTVHSNKKEEQEVPQNASGVYLVCYLLLLSYYA